MSDVRRESGGEMSPDPGCADGGGQPDEYGGGFEYIDEVGLTTAVVAIVAEGYGRSALIRSIFSRLMTLWIPLRGNVSLWVGDEV